MDAANLIFAIFIFGLFVLIIIWFLNKMGRVTNSYDERLKIFFAYYSQQDIEFASAAYRASRLSLRLAGFSQTRLQRAALLPKGRLKPILATATASNQYFAILVLTKDHRLRSFDNKQTFFDIPLMDVKSVIFHPSNWANKQLTTIITSDGQELSFMEFQAIDWPNKSVISAIKSSREVKETWRNIFRKNNVSVE